MAEAEQITKPECDRNTPSHQGFPAIDSVPLPDSHIVRTNDLPCNVRGQLNGIMLPLEVPSRA